MRTLHCNVDSTFRLVHKVRLVIFRISDHLPQVTTYPVTSPTITLIFFGCCN